MWRLVFDPRHARLDDPPRVVKNQYVGKCGENMAAVQMSNLWKKNAGRGPASPYFPLLWRP
jgi:hypothetical protein